MLLTQSNLNRVKDTKEYKENFNQYTTVEELDIYIANTLEIDNINILVNNIIRVINIINGIEDNNETLEIKELILKANLSENRENFKNILELLESSSDEKIIRINRIFDKTLLNNLDKKIDLLIKLEDISKLFYPNFTDKLIMNTFKEEIEEIESVDINQSVEEYREPVSKSRIVVSIIVLIAIIVGTVLFFTFDIVK